MKTIGIVLLLSIISFGLFSQQPNLEIHTPEKSWVSLINKQDIGDAEYGWWTIWHEMKKNKQYNVAEFVDEDENGKIYGTKISDIQDGNYVLVVFLPGATFYDEMTSDGLVIEAFYVDGGTIYLGDEPLYSNQLSFISEDFTEWNCLSCPFLYVHNGSDYIKLTEILKDVAGEKNKCQTAFEIPKEYVINNKLKIMISEEKEETTYLDELKLMVDEKPVNPITSNPKLNLNDNNYLIMKKGNKTFIEYQIKTNAKSIILESTGYYNPSKAYINHVYNKYLNQ